MLHGGRIYLTSAVPIEGKRAGDQSLEALCVDAATGELVWRERVFLQDGATAPLPQPKNGHASPTPVVSGGRLYVHFGHQGTACLNLAGDILWRNDTIKYDPRHGNGGSPILAGGALVFSCDGYKQRFVIALDRDSGKRLWRHDRRGPSVRKFSFTTPLLIAVGGRQQVISPGSDVVGAHDPRTGQEIWRVRYETGYSVIPRPVYGHGLVYVVTGYNTPRVLAIRPTGEGDVTETHVEWETDRGAPHTPSLLLVDDELYMVSDKGVARCLDARSGKLHWRERIGGNYSASPVYADGNIYFQNEQGDGTVIEPGKRFKLLAKNSLGERTFASYAVADGTLFIRSETHLYRIAAR